jgi:hypothetical protein
MFMSNSHTSNILFSKALTDTTYVDLMKIAYSGVVSIPEHNINQRYNGCSGRSRWCRYFWTALCGSEFDASITTSGITTTYGMTSRNDIYTDTYR